MSIEEFKVIKSIEEFKARGTISELTKMINEIVAPLRIEAETYETLHEIFQCLLEKWSDFMNGPFVNKKAEYTFYLTKLEGKQRNKMLGITDEMYESPKLAKQWYLKIAKLVHPDAETDKTSEAFIILQQLYDVMTDNGEDDIDER